MKLAIHKTLIDIPRPFKIIILILVDTVIITLSSWLAFCFRFDSWHTPNTLQKSMILLSTLITILTLVIGRFYTSITRFQNDKIVIYLIRNTSAATIIWSVCIFFLAAGGSSGVPRSVPVIYFFFVTFGILCSRYFAQWILKTDEKSNKFFKYTFIYGTNESARQLVSALRSDGELMPFAYIDDDANVIGTEIDGLKVYDLSQLADIASRYAIKDIIITDKGLFTTKNKKLINEIERLSLHMKVLPSLTDLAKGKHLVNLVRDIDLGDLIDRAPIVADSNVISRDIRNKVVAVTGAGGSIGSELCRQIMLLEPTKLLLIDISEYNLYKIEIELKAIASCEVIPYLGSISDRGFVSKIFKDHKINAVFHAAAYKHVPLVEGNMLSGIFNNVFGTLNLCKIASENDIDILVMISTDKAVRPTSVMGATKRLSELIIQDFNSKAKESHLNQKYCSVRFGNVIGSSGSVIPLFKDQIASGGPLTITHPEVTRYFMSIHEAVQLVLNAGYLSQGGEVYLLDMGKPVKIIELAYHLVSLLGKTVKDLNNPNGDIPIIFTGLRPGEKLYEELLVDVTTCEVTSNPLIMRANEPSLDHYDLYSLLDSLSEAIAKDDEQMARKHLFSVN